VRLVGSGIMKLMKQIGQCAAVVGVVAAGLMGPLASTANAKTSEAVNSANAPVDVGIQAEWYGPYSSQGYCNYLAGMMRNAGHTVTDCFDLTLSGDWYFIVY
jgi:hypothetical protein